MKRSAPKSRKKKKVVAKKASAKRRSRKKKKKAGIGKVLVKYLLLFSFFATLGAAGYKYRNEILHYLSFKTNKYARALTKEEREAANFRVSKVVAHHKDKVFGIDVSHYQGKINWRKVKNSKQEFPIHFVFIRATAGYNKKDSQFKRNWRKTKNKGYLRGAYHYYRPDENSIAQADNFIKTVKLKKGDLPPVLDIERIPDRQSMKNLKIGLQRWLDKVEEHYGVKPILYSGQSYYTDFLKKEFKGYKLWIASYSIFEEDIRREWRFWQFTDRGEVEGIEGDVDVNVHNGDLKRLKELLKK
ncbi:MAG: glycoside hydrolase [Flavobacterium sp. MedPE-SWcel]|uniref:glycoside hydrolase family 25 protein n=1 Tax=uncultured Flavobacterium sp. TaxID=165435 RepID=UPI0009215F0B|nr:glycoside hydrolase family 25 protein [uncultured Flavobacterium sp.]OIQ21454.1 MAG: glycoside hydrolase [Flavobacterium sp. MedPE-SWcel]